MIETKVESPVCIKCGHDSRWLRGGICGYFYVPVTELVAPCGCKCEFPPVESRIENDEPAERCRDCGSSEAGSCFYCKAD